MWKQAFVIAVSSSPPKTAVELPSEQPDEVLDVWHDCVSSEPSSVEFRSGSDGREWSIRSDECGQTLRLTAIHPVPAVHGETRQSVLLLFVCRLFMKCECLDEVDRREDRETQVFSDCCIQTLSHTLQSSWTQILSHQDAAFAFM